MIRLIPQALALFALLSLSFFLGPDAYTEFLVKLTGYSGALQFGLAFTTYILGIVFLICLTIPNCRKALLVNKEKAIAVVLTIIICGYVFWGTYMLYSLSQATDL